MKHSQMVDVKMLIKMNGFTMNEIAKQCGISRRTAYRWLDSFSIEKHQAMVKAIETLRKERGD